MNKSELYKLPKDILIELLCKTNTLENVQNILENTSYNEVVKFHTKLCKNIEKCKNAGGFTHQHSKTVNNLYFEVVNIDSIIICDKLSRHYIHRDIYGGGKYYVDDKVVNKIIQEIFSEMGEIKFGNLL